MVRQASRPCAVPSFLTNLCRAHIPLLRRVSAWLTLNLRLISVVGVLWALPASAADKSNEFDPEQPHTNGLEMRFVPVPETGVLFSVYETRVRDFRAFVRETGYVHMRETSDPDSRMWSLDKVGLKQRGHSWQDPGFAQTDEHPVVGVSWRDAKAFCGWLTLRERTAGRLPQNAEYRLPTDHEWSVAVGLNGEDPKKTPEEKGGFIKDKYPWGQWPEGKPPPDGAGNYAGEEADDEHWPDDFYTISGYDDGYARTAPVGSYKPNRYGLYDLGGNVWEWCEDKYRPVIDARVLRGASWVDFGRDALLSSCRVIVRPGFRYVIYGFRCVVGVVSPKR